MNVRCENCLGMGYKGHWRLKRWVVASCRSCGGTGSKKGGAK